MPASDPHKHCHPCRIKKRTPVQHYMDGGLECIDVMRKIASKEGFLEHCRLTAFKYLWRLGKKDKRSKELGKAMDYMTWAKETAEEIESGQG